MGIVGTRSSLCLCDCGQILPLYTVIFSPMKPQDWVLGSFWKEAGGLIDKMLKCLAMENFYLKEKSLTGENQAKLNKAKELSQKK
ncbi:hypothetical protein MJG53_004692 [Ovis ammon polii x Ovis aries]|uniref:Uncharacterized protein n=2 Tax=Ovis TaxID=9935 RepID=A0A836A7R3_SHEEP|nr:hypothetical protein JEQ12_014285 [Ovis aries]KAI4576894.1 hypothetical protein MJT46_002729 [Ovis ammon polii x Ovis aries]KAI4586905.1 hypothetical protein MJG53_004692 [Ovis ammon polii x Ovis aries]